MIDLDFSRFFPCDEFDRLTRVGILKRAFRDNAQPTIAKSRSGQVPGQNVISRVATVPVLIRPGSSEGFSVVCILGTLVFDGQGSQVSGRFLREDDMSRTTLDPCADPFPGPLSIWADEKP